jgi:phosphatidylinositol alpha-mannosyltransferase
MRISLISPYALSLPGGVQEQVIGLSRLYGQRGHEVQILAPDASDAGSYRTDATIRRFGRLWSLPANGSRAPITLSPSASVSIAHAVTDFRSDIVHAHEPFAPVAAYATLARHHVPVLATVHRSGWGPAYSLTRLVTSRLTRAIDDVVAVSESAASTFQRATNRSCEIAWNGIDVPLGIDSSARDNIIVAVGRLEPRKGVSSLIDAFALFRHDHPSHRLVLIGDGPQRTALEARARDIGGIEFAGRVSDAERDRWLARARIVACPALGGESFGIVLAEAMAAGAAVVASDIDGYRQVAGDGAILAAPGSADAWNVALRRAIVEWPELVERGRQRAQRFSFDALADNYLERFERLIAPRDKR